MGRSNPLCHKCGKEHWNFTGCGEQKPAPELVRQKREDGLDDWGERLYSYTRRGNLYLIKDQQIERGRLTGPEGWTPPEAA